MSSRFLTTLGVVLCVLGVTVAAAAVPVTAGTTAQAHPQQSHPPVEGEVDIDPSDLPGDGSESTPYEISNVSELQAMEGDLDANYELVSDIDASDTAQFNDGRGFDPVGSFSESPAQPFRGSLDGNNNTVTGLTITRPSDSGIGLFGFTGSEATLANITLTGINTTGDTAVGGLVGSNSGTVADARASGDVTGEAIVGGLVGFNNGTTANGIIRTARASVSVIGGEGPVGGLVGVNRQGVIQTARASGSVTGDMGGSVSIGGLVGFNNGMVQTARASGSVTGRDNVGGLVGQNGGGNDDVEIRDTFAAGSITGETGVGGLVGRNYATVEQSYFDTQATGQSASAGSATGLTTAEMQRQAARTNMSGLDFDTTWTTTSEYPALRGLSGRQIPGTVDLTGVNLAVSSNGSIDLRGNLINTRGSEISGAVVQVVSSEYVTPEYPRQSYFVGTLDSSQFAPIELTASANIENATEVTVRIEYTVGTDRVVETVTISLPTDNETDESAGSGSGGEDPIQVDVDPSDLSGDGSESNPYEISNVSELQAMEDDLDADYELVSDIDASQTAQFNDGAGFDPVGEDSVNLFTGSVNGNNHRISGLTITRVSETEVGLFGVTSDSATVRNLVFTDLSVTGKRDVGGLIGFNRGKVQNVTVSGSVSGDRTVGGLIGSTRNSALTDITSSVDTDGSRIVGGGIGKSINMTIRNASASGQVFGLNKTSPQGGSVGEPGRVGGLVGESLDSRIIDSKATGDVITSGRNAGGLVGGVSIDNTIISSTATGDVTTRGGDTQPRFFAGGLISRNGGGVIRDSRATGDVTGYRRVGGLAGDNSLGDLQNPNPPGKIINSSAAGDVFGSENVGGLVGININGGVITQSTASGDVTGVGRVNRSGNNRANNQLGGLAGGNNNATITSSTATGEVSGERDIGGLVGLNNRGAVISNSTAATQTAGSNSIGGLVGLNADTGRIRDTFAVGSVTGDQNVGGAVGLNATGATVERSYFDTQTTGQSTSDGSATGLTTTEMQGTAAIENMNLTFGETWQTVSGDYPELIALTDPDTDSDEGSQSDPESAQFEITLTETSEAVPVGEQLIVTTQITNTGSQQTEATIQLTTTAGTATGTDTNTDTQSLTLASGDSTTQTLTVDISDVQPGTYTATVSVGITAAPSGSGGDGQTETVNSTSTEFAVSPLEGAPGEFDTDGDGEIGITEVSTAAADFIDGDLSIGDISQIAAEFIN